MKKNIKYAGIAAATLLMVAPLAAPVFSTTSTAKAADDTTGTTTTGADATAGTDTSSSTDSETPTLDAKTQKALDGVFATLQSSTTYDPTLTTYFDDIANNYTKKDYSATFPATDAKSIYGLVSIQAARFNQPDSTYPGLLSAAGVTFGIQGVKDGQVLTSANDFKLYAKSAGSSGVTLRVTAYKGDAAVGSKDLTFTPAKAAEGITSVALKYTDPYTVALGSSTSDPQYTSTVDATATDQDGKAIEVTNPTPGAIYTSKEAAYSADSTKLVSGDTFDTDGATYYQPVTVTLDKSADLGKIYYDYEQGNGSGITLNGTDAIKKNVNSGATYNPPAAGTTVTPTAQTLTYIRTIKVSSTTADNWTVTPIKGVVTVGDSIAALCDDNGKPSTGRSLAAGTPWLTDEKRVNKSTGAVQYRVSTHEWVAAEDVSYSDGQTPAGGLTDITDLEGRHVVNLDGPAGFVYSLYDSTGKLASRGLAGATSWLTDKTAKGSDGATYYRVSTDEWIKAGNGVNFE